MHRIVDFVFLSMAPQLQHLQHGWQSQTQELGLRQMLHFANVEDRCCAIACWNTTLDVDQVLLWTQCASEKVFFFYRYHQSPSNMPLRHIASDLPTIDAGTMVRAHEGAAALSGSATPTMASALTRASSPWTRRRPWPPCWRSGRRGGSSSPTRCRTTRRA